MTIIDSLRTHQQDGIHRAMLLMKDFQGGHSRVDTALIDLAVLLPGLAVADTVLLGIAIYRAAKGRTWLLGDYLDTWGKFLQDISK